MLGVLYLLAMLALPLSALIAGLFLAGDPHRWVIGRLVGVVLVLIAAFDSVAVGRSLSCSSEDPASPCADGDVLRLALFLTLFLLALGAITRSRKRESA